MPLRIQVHEDGRITASFVPASPPPPLEKPEEPVRVWADGTPIAEDDGYPEPWGSDPRDRWVRVLAEEYASPLWDVSGMNRHEEELPISPVLQGRIRRWGELYARLQAEADRRVTWTVTHRFWEERDDMPLAAYNALGLRIARALKAALPHDWIVLYQCADAWRRNEATPSGVVVFKGIEEREL